MEEHGITLSLIYQMLESVGTVLSISSSSIDERTDDATLCHECDLTGHHLSVSLLFILCRVSTTISPTPGTLTHSLFTMETREASQMESSEKVESLLRPGRSRVDLILI